MHPWQVCFIVLFGMAIISCSLRLIKLGNRLSKLEKMLRDTQPPRRHNPSSSPPGQ